MAASPSPMTRCHVPIAVARAASGIGAAPPTAYSPTNTNAAARTEATAPTAAARGTAPSLRGRAQRVATKTA